MAEHVGRSKKTLDGIHARWIARRHRNTDDLTYRDEWYDEQCGGCRFWFPLAGEMGSDYGACANGDSPFDGRVMFEHDGCAAFEEADEWVTPESM
ncbi:hypothetical protein Cs7R123_44560 [Catellatospora sp. TT07R-123]|nr:hypothetical protein Cs7R123_44560 [Catellatospora sp. TT07R-123]